MGVSSGHQLEVPWEFLNGPRLGDLEMFWSGIVMVGRLGYQVSFRSGSFFTIDFLAYLNNAHFQIYFS